MRIATAAMALIAFASNLPTVLLASNPMSAPMSQTSREAASDTLSPANAVTGPDFPALLKMMRKNINKCGAPHTAVLHWHVQADGIIDDFILNKSSGDTCFDEVVILNADAVVRTRLRITPAMRNGVAEAAWLPFAVAARD